MLADARSTHSRFRAAGNFPGSSSDHKVMGRMGFRPASTAVPHPGEDLGLIQRARHGAAEAYDELFRRHRDRVARAAYLLLGDSEQAQDATQEAFLIGWRDLRRLRDPERFGAWLTGIALNQCRRRRRTGARERRWTDAEEAAPDDADSAALRIEVRRAVDALPRQMREAVVLRYYCGFVEAEMAAALGVPAGTVKSRLGRARARLAVALRAAVEVER
jgi:RNA polymerase sigma-70 factor (ECF subfamily)